VLPGRMVAHFCLTGAELGQTPIVPGPELA
jgi:hypothetical protein